MASAFAHALSAVTLRVVTPQLPATRKLLLLGIVCSVLPDIDSIGHALGVPYHSVWGHRGITHSLSFALFTSIVVCSIFLRDYFRDSVTGWMLLLYFFLVTASHGLLDAMTNGGLGIAFFAPFDNERYFLPLRPIAVSPIGIRAFFGEWGQRVIISELIWIGIPCTALLFMGWAGRRLRLAAAESGH